MGLDQLGFKTVRTFVPKQGGHNMSHITMLLFLSWSTKPPLIIGSPKVITLEHISCNTWSTRH